ncbi:MAG: twin-arginine translocase subunit TatC [Acidimicrobiales bacterium]|nr:twin-arginine translocase subunit TatC [Acidimicrobiales bacterium]MCB1250149.1 twin-arginine translocase subunit TatC [Acidimicrobiales bacterium]MCB1261878.1 twin-arginine translocase subunit TatC [Acidimicrobiales bacterium]
MTEAKRAPSGLPDDARMTIWEHLAELRTRIIRAFLALAIGSFVGWFLYPYVVSFLVRPYESIQPDATLYATSFLEPFSIRIQTSVYLGVALAMPVILWQIWRFVTPGLYPNERRAAIPFMASALFLFVLGATIAYLTLPAALSFLIDVAGADIEVIPTVDSYLKLNLFMMLAFGIGMEFPVLLVALQLIGILEPSQLSKWRRYAIVVIAVIAAVITPSGDPISMMALAVPMYIFYEISILLGRLFARRRRKAEAAAAG